MPAKSTPILLSVIVLLVASLACSAPTMTVIVTATPGQDFWNTAVAETVSAALEQSQVAPSVLPVDVVTEIPPQAFTPTLVPTITQTPAPLFTPTPVIPQIMVSVATNCRVGPGKVYDRMGALTVGQVAEVYGRNGDGTYWYVRLPNGSYCWVWGQYATISGNIGALPVYTPPPTPTPVPDFDASYSDMVTCAGWWVNIDVSNTGGVTFKSLTLSLRDTVTDVVLTSYADGFTLKGGCLDTGTRDNLNPGATRTFSSPAFDYDPSGHKLRATITLCTNLGQNGTCVTKVISFTP